MVGATLLGNLEWMVFCSLALPPPLTLPFLLVKPQVGIGLAIVLVYYAYKNKALLPMISVLIALIFLSFIFYGQVFSLPTAETEALTNHADASAFPWLVPVGILFVYAAIKSDRFTVGFMASPMFAWHVTPGSWGSVIFSLALNQPFTLVYAAVIIQWGLLLCTTLLRIL
jgi:hypothetical protein